MQKYKITKLGKKFDVNTQYGVKQKFYMGVEGSENDLSVWASKTTDEWKVGDSVEGTITQSAGKNGTVYYNFDLPKKNDQALEKVLALEITVDMLKRKVARLEEEKQNKPEYNKTSDGKKVPDFSEVDNELGF
jgi:hypothetical protein